MNTDGTGHRPMQKRAEATRQALLDAALELFSERGFHGTNTKEVAARAGVATGSVYRYFTNKKALFLAVMSRMEDAMRGQIFGLGRELAASGAPPRQTMERLVGFALEAHRPHRAFHREVLAMTLLDPDVARVEAEREGRVRRELMDFLADMPGLYPPDDLEAAAEMIHLSVEEVAHRAVIFDSPIGEERLTRMLLDMLGAWLVIENGA